MRRVVVAFLLVVTSGTAYARQRDSERQAVDSLAVEIMGDTVSVWDFGAYENCNCEFVTAVTRVGDTLNIMQMDVEPVAARCNCLQDMRTSITGLPAGAYTAAVAISGTDADFFFPYVQNTAGSGLSVRCLKD